jgi:hypothetical protein
VVAVRRREVLVKRAFVILVVLVLASALASTVATALTPPPTPGTAAQDKALVAAATKITNLPSNLIPTLQDAPSDDAAAYYPSSNASSSGCSTSTQCVYGDLSSSTTVVLYGDSHAEMWLPALAPAATKLNLKLVLIWHPGCQVEDFLMANTNCDSDRTHDIALINALKPAMVLLSQKVTQITGPHGKTYSNAQWTDDLEVTIRALQNSSTKVVVVGDTNQFNESVPVCLSLHSSKVQSCTIFNPNPKFTQHFAAEAAAATDTHAGYINPTTWMCNKKCSAVVGTMVVCSDDGHITATFAEYFTGLWETALTKLGE